MSYNAAANFCQRNNGIKSLLEFIKLCNNPKYDLSRLARHFETSKVNLCRYRKTILVVRYVPDQGTLDYLKIEKNDIQDNAREGLDEIDETLEGVKKLTSPLRLIYAK